MSFHSNNLILILIGHSMHNTSLIESMFLKRWVKMLLFLPIPLFSGFWAGCRDHNWLGVRGNWHGVWHCRERSDSRQHRQHVRQVLLRHHRHCEGTELTFVSLWYDLFCSAARDAFCQISRKLQPRYLICSWMSKWYRNMYIPIYMNM